MEILALGKNMISQLNNDEVTLMTIHSAKGLEFEVVFLVGMEEGIFPGYKSIGEQKELEEENHYKDMEELVDKVAAKKTYRALKRKGDTKKVILDKLQAKYAISREQARLLYKEFSDK